MLEAYLVLFLCYCILFLLSITKKDNSIADIFWGIGYIIISIFLFIIESSQSYLHISVLAIILLWGGRLSFLFFMRKRKHKEEDDRYAQWRKKWRYFYIRSFFQIYLLQMLLMCMISIPLLYIFTSDHLHPIVTMVGCLIAIMGLIYEIIADRQVLQFINNKKRDKNTIYTGGLWKYSRNPNYFGESIFWLGISVISLPISIYGIIGYLMISYLLLYVSGIPMKESRQKKKNNWVQYSKNTNKFIPWFPKQ